jgi:hypothetical protein
LHLVGRLHAVGRVSLPRDGGENGASATQAPAHTEIYDVDAVFMLLERNAACLIGPLPDGLKPDIQYVRTHWNRGFIAFQLARRARIVVLMVPMWPESGFPEKCRSAAGRSGDGNSGLTEGRREKTE